MRHLKRGVKLGREREARRALLLGLASALILHEKIKTTEKKAKALIPQVEELVNLAKQNQKRKLLQKGLRKNVFLKLTEEVGKWYPGRKSGYLKVVPLYYRKGDNTKVFQVSFSTHKDIEIKKEGKVIQNTKDKSSAKKKK